MRLVILLLSFVLLIGFNVGCNQGNNFNHEIAVVDSLQISLDEVVLAYKNWDIDSLANLRLSMENEMSYLSKLMKNGNDTLNRKNGLFLGDYKTNSNAFKKVKSNDEKFLKEIELSNKQLATLKKDLQGGAISDVETVKSFLNKEKESVGTLIEGLSRIDEIYHVGMNKYTKMNPRVTHILDSLTLRNNN